MKQMNAAFVTRYYERPSGGIGNYERFLYPHLANIAEIQQTPIQPYPLPNWSIRAASLLGRDLGTFTTNFPFYFERNFPLVHLSNEILGFALLFYQGRSVITVHHLPNLLSAQFRQEIGGLWWLYMLAMVGVKRATRIIVDSNWTGTQVQSQLKIPQKRIDVIPLGVDHTMFRPRIDANEVRDQYQLGVGPHVLYVGGMDERKNLAVLFSAFSRLKSRFPCAELLLVGPQERGLKKLKGVNSELLRNCRLLGFVPAEDLVKLYNFVTLLVIPSKLEGFGLPVLEAMACGCPVVVSSAAALPEVAGAAGLYFDPDDENALLDGMVRVLSDPILRDELSERSRKQAALFDWRTTAELTVASYRKATVGEKRQCS